MPDAFYPVKYQQGISEMTGSLTLERFKFQLTHFLTVDLWQVNFSEPHFPHPCCGVTYSLGETFGIVPDVYEVLKKYP